MKKLLVAASFLVSVASFAQNPDKEDCGDHNYIQYPSDLALQGMTSYFVTSTVPNNNAYTMEAVSSATVLEGFTKTVTEGSADFIVNYTVFPITFTPAKYEMKTHEYEKDGVKKKSYTHYYDSQYSYRVDVQIVDQAGTQIYQNSLSGTNSISKSSTTSAADAKTQHDSEVKKVQGSHSNGVVTQLSREINNRYCTMNKVLNLRLITIKAKKFEYDGFNKATESMKSLANVSDQAEKNKICEAAIALWREDLKESAPDDRKARVDKGVTAGAYYNIANAFFVMGDYQQAGDNFEKAQEFDKAVTLSHDTYKEIAKDMVIRMALQAQ